MKKILWLDWMVNKMLLSWKYIILWLVLGAFIAVSAGSLAGAYMGVLVGTSAATMPFLYGEKTNMNAWYVTLGISRKDVVRGRYISSLLFAVVTTLVGLVYGYLISVGAGLLGFGNPELKMIDAKVSFFCALTAILFAILDFSITLPIYFGMGYQKGQYAAIIPYIIICIAGGVGMGFVGDKGLAVLGYIVTHLWWIMLVVSIIFVALYYVSYLVSAKLFARKEF
ncbi:MAG TPA: ABC-2 transporter permease [Aeriscardovia aeriphila]|uniref:ABC-2 transporter permease n=1 Tax=Aeriscardovia aeriphila TaxID=218139 RepID=A0A921FTB9_9BIFI|nr:ABC-2 transporter permease [Aeriscardovia aeriphila]